MLVATTVPVPSLSAAELNASRAFREKFGLRADDLWISQVAADPLGQAGVAQFDVPLMPWELEQLLVRANAAAEVSEVIAKYGLTVPDDWHASFIDQQRGGIVVVDVYRNADLHRAALERLLSPNARWEVREVDQRTLEQIAFVDRVKADQAWFATIDAKLLDVVTNPMDGGIVELTYIAESRDLGPVISDHYGAPDWLRVDWAGAPPWTGPVGDLIVLAVDEDGRPVPGLLCTFGGSSSGQLTGPDGTCRFPGAPAKEHHVLLCSDVEGAGCEAGSARFTVRANELNTVRIVVNEP